MHGGHGARVRAAKLASACALRAVGGAKCTRAHAMRSGSKGGDSAGGSGSGRDFAPSVDHLPVVRLRPRLDMLAGLKRAPDGRIDARHAI